MNQTPRIRHSARILLVDEIDRLFLFKGQDLANKLDVFWYPVGGGIELGESPEEAIFREVHEETGLVAFALGPHIWNREVIVSFNGEMIHSKEKWFFSRVKYFEVDTSGFSDIENETTLDQKWWTFEEIIKTQERLTPWNLPALLAPLIEGHFPKPPFDLLHEESHF